MDALVDKVFSIKDSFQDGLLVLPHLLSGFFFFIGLFTTNIGMLCIAIGQLVIVPVLSHFANGKFPISYDKDGKFVFNVMGIASTLAASLIIMLIIISSIGGLTGFIVGPLLIGLLLIVNIIYSLFGNDPISLFDSVNPSQWIFGPPEKREESNTALCYLSPEEMFTKGQPVQRRSPSGWTIHVLFFFGFLLANAYTMYDMPPPVLKPTGDAKIDSSSKEQLNIRVNNRKIITGTIFGLCLIGLLAILYVRMTLMPCEDSIFSIAFPMLYCFLFGIAWFTVITKSCGIPASDILGLVQGFISPQAIDNPIVCIGSDPGPLRN